ncbi:MAG: cupin domain-containing protein [Nitrospiraceae bacterium]
MMTVISLKDYQQFSPDKMKKNNLFKSPRFFCDVYCFEPGQEQKGHVHGDQDKVYIVLDGEGTFQIGRDTRVLGSGLGTLAPAGEEHGVKNHTNQRLRVLVLVAPNP